MENETFHIRLEARNPEKGHFRAYRIDAGRDLFGRWKVDVSYGRIGQKGRSVTYSAPDDAGAATIVRHCLKRRASAPRRIGVPYSIRALQDPHGWSAARVG